MDNKFDNEKKGVAFLKESENPNAPKWDGKMTIDGKEWRFALWEKTSRNGKEMLTMKISEPRSNTTYQRDVPPNKESHYKAKGNGYAPKDRDDDIPF
jgi:uncharacterized protein (DUF736 family)